MLTKFKNKGNILIIGDLNARTENEVGLHEKLGKLSHLLANIGRTILETDNRCSCDIKTSERKMVTICSRHGLEIANGQTPWDRYGNFTCFKQ